MIAFDSADHTSKAGPGVKKFQAPARKRTGWELNKRRSPKANINVYQNNLLGVWRSTLPEVILSLATSPPPTGRQRSPPLHAKATISQIPSPITCLQGIKLFGTNSHLYTPWHTQRPMLRTARPVHIPASSPPTSAEAVAARQTRCQQLWPQIRHLQLAM